MPLKTLIPQKVCSLILWIQANTTSSKPSAQELGKNPFRRFGVIDFQNNNGAMNGIGVQVGYKQFFGKKKELGVKVLWFL